MDWLCENWDQPDEGIWETRGGRQDFVYGRLMSWVAFDRAIRMAAEPRPPADLARWTASADAIYDADHGQGLERRARRVRPALREATSSTPRCCCMPLVGFVAPNDPRWLSTLDAMDSELVSDSLVYRYDPAASPDGLQGLRGHVLAVHLLVRRRPRPLGPARRGPAHFEKMLTYANHVGLFSEEIGATGEQLGNFPQAFTHLSLINAAINLDHQLDHGADTGPV